MRVMKIGELERFNGETQVEDQGGDLVQLVEAVETLQGEVIWGG